MKLTPDRQTVTITFSDEVLPSEMIVELGRNPTTEPNVVDYYKGFIFHHKSQLDKKWVVIAAEKKRKRHLKTVF